MAFADSFLQNAFTGTSPVSAHLEAARAFGTEVEEQIEAPPDIFQHVWEWFLELSGQRGTGFGSRDPLSFQEIRSWSALTQQPVAVHELKLLLSLDGVFLKHARRKKAPISG